MSSTLAPSEARFSRSTLPVVLATTLLVTLNTAIVNVALAGIQQDLGFTTATLSWVINGYLLSYGGFLIVGGRLGDIIGRRRTMLIGLIIFTAASAVAAFAWSPWVLVAARVVQGVGGALASPAVLATITHLLHGEARAKALGWFSVVTGAGMSIGMIAGGVIVQWLSWRWIFLLNIPAGVLLVILTAVAVPALRAEHRHRLDLVGALLATLTAVGLVLTFVQLAGARAVDTVVIVSVVVAVLAFIGLAARLRTAAEPLIPLALFERRTAIGAFAANALLGGAMTGVVFFLSELFGAQLGLEPLAIGALFLVFTTPQLAAALSAGNLIRRLGARKVIVASLIIGIVGLLLLAAATVSGTISIWLIVGMVLTGAGIGGVFLGINLTVMSTVDHRVAGAASGVLQTSLQLGASLGIAILVFAQALFGTTAAFIMAAIFVALALVALSVRDRMQTEAE